MIKTRLFNLNPTSPDTHLTQNKLEESAWYIPHSGLMLPLLS